jgi:hypothetical protein
MSQSISNLCSLLRTVKDIEKAAARNEQLKENDADAFDH